MTGEEEGTGMGMEVDDGGGRGWSQQYDDGSNLTAGAIATAFTAFATFTAFIGGGKGPKCPYNRMGSSKRRKTSSFDDPTDSKKGGSGDDQNGANFTMGTGTATIEEEGEADTVMVTREKGGIEKILIFNMHGEGRQSCTMYVSKTLSYLD